MANTVDVQKGIAPQKQIFPQIYAYSTPDLPKYNGWLKIGYTTRKNVDERIAEQRGQANLDLRKQWSYRAFYLTTGKTFDDHVFHHYLTNLAHIKRDPGTEWFDFEGDVDRSKELFKDFAAQDVPSKEEDHVEYTLRPEQQAAVNQTVQYYHSNAEDRIFLWNAKPRFGKTLATYDFMKEVKADTVLIVTNRPAIANSWFDDYDKFISGDENDYLFVSESDSLKERAPLSRTQYLDLLSSSHPNAKQIAFISLQDLKGSMHLSGNGQGLDKLKWVRDTNWDLLVVDEAHEGTDTIKTSRMFDQIKRGFTLYLSGTPFKAIAKGTFSENQIYNWSYADEQQSKLNWDNEKTGHNPYEGLPALNMYTYQMSKMIRNQVDKGMDLDDGQNIDFAFDLNEFFSTNDSGVFVHDKDVDKWLDTLISNEKFPFSTDRLRQELAHTFWIMNRVRDAKAMQTKLAKHPVFKKYTVVLAAGDGKNEDVDTDNTASKKSFDRVKEAISKNDKTITLSVGQLTTGVTVKEWTAVLMLSNMKSPAQYMQAAFRAQNPWQHEDSEGNVVRKENAYVFDFAPERTLVIFDEFANNLLARTANGRGTSEERKSNITKLLNFFPVIGEDEDGKMIELDAAQVLTIPKAIKAKEVIKRGFMSNLLFANIAGIFSAPAAVRDILNKMNPEDEGRVKSSNESIDTSAVDVDDEGNVVIDNEVVIGETEGVFGDKVFVPDETDLVNDDVQDDEKNDTSSYNQSPDRTLGSRLAEQAKEYFVTEEIVDTIRNTYHADERQSKKLNDRIQATIEKKIETAVSQTVETAQDRLEQDKTNIRADLNEILDSVTDETEKSAAEKAASELLQQKQEEFNDSIGQLVSEATQEATREVIKNEIERTEEKKKSAVEEDVRARLRGFARTIPSFIMAYGTNKSLIEQNGDLTLANFDDFTPDDVFEEVTGVTESEFRMLRDGGTFKDDDGNEKSYPGLFDEATFNESIQEFLALKQRLNNYFDESQEEDIFDYIPPQQTNQIFTPKRVVKEMVDAMEKDNPGIFDDPNRTFADLYMKSGLYITEIVKRLYRSEKMISEIPDKKARIKHILENQVYGFAPSGIIFGIATSFIFGFDDTADEISRRHFIQHDTLADAKTNSLDSYIQSTFGENA